MFRIESYLTSIILSYVDRYIKNFRRQDAQVSLWEGDGSFQNLNLDLEVLEQELNLPFSFVSGHINELLIHVPWTRIASEPVRITINTIECVMKLRTPGSCHTSLNDAKHQRLNQQVSGEEPVTPPSYISSLVNKIICNLSITCNNLILKYVEEDIVLSMNIKTLSLGTVNANWKPEFSELNPNQLTLRKLISLADVTICLDKRNASGRIESYLEPLLYRCFMTLRLSRTYPSVNASRASSTRLDILCKQMAFTLSEPQIPMLMRLIALGLALNRKQFSSQVVDSSLNDEGTEGSENDNMSNEGLSIGESWTTWAFSWMPAILPLVIEDENNPYDPAFLQIDHTFRLGVYIDVLTLAFKLCENDTGVVSGVKGQTQPFLHITLCGSRMDIMSHGQEWMNIQMGVSQATVRPDGDCCCGALEPSNQLPYLTSGSVQETTSIVPVNTEKDSSTKERTWDYHLATVTETLLLEKTPAFAIDYLFCLERLENDEEYENEDEDSESILKRERVLLRYVAGPVVIRVCSGCIHRIQMLLKAASNYDYPPYINASSVPTTDPKTVEAVSKLISEGTEIDEELASCYFPVHISQFTAFNTTVEFYPANHLPVHQGVLGRKLSRLQKRAQNSLPVPNSPPPSVIVDWKCIYAKLTRPMNTEKIIAVSAIFEQNNFPREMIRAAETRLAFKVVGVRSSVRIPESQPMALLEMNSLAFEQTFHSLLTCSEKDITSDFRIHIGSATVTSTKAKLVLLTEIICSLFATNNRVWHQSCYNVIYNTTLLQDAAATTEIIYLKLNIDELVLRRVVTAVSNTVHMSIGASQVFIVKVLDRERTLDTMILAAPDTDSNSTGHLFELIFQHPIGECIYVPFLSFKLCEMRVSLDPLFYTWLLYTPKCSGTGHQPIPVLKSWTSIESNKTRRASESSMGSHARRAPTPQESVHSSSERETTPSGHVSSQPILETVHPAPTPPLSERVCTWYPVWKSIIVCGDISQLGIYLPNYSLVRAEPQSMESSLQSGLKQTLQHLQVVVVKMPTISLRCAASKQNLSELPLTIPVVLPDHMWSKDKSNFPWTLNVSDLHCYTLQGGTCLQLLKPVSLNCTIGTSPKFSSGNMTSLALCMYLDTTPVAISLSEEQVRLLTLLAMSQLQLFRFYLSTWWTSGNQTQDDSLSSIKLVSSSESLNSSQPDDKCDGMSGSRVKLSGWLQWTLERFTLTIYSQPKTSRTENLKLTLDIEDVILSLDVERVYHKIKLKVASASVKHYTRPSIKHIWKLGAYKGLVMRGYDPEGLGISNTVKHSIEDTPAPSGLLTATLTRAQCNNLHSRLGSPSKAGSLTKKTQGFDTENQFITEIVVKLQPLDFVVSPSTLATFVHVLDPLIRRSGMKESVPKQSEGPPTMLNSSSLPLVYLELMAIRIMLPASYNTKEEHEHDVVILQLDSVVISPQPENPICRTPLRPDIYHAAEKHRILNIPGSEVEDRQYQLDLVSIKLNTGVWSELEEVLSQEVSVSPVQNPALDWNEGRQPHSNPPTPQLVSTIISSFNVCVVIAPAILYRNKVIVCGHSAEINAVSEINVTLTLSQLCLCLMLVKEAKMLLASTYSEDSHSSRAGHSTNIATVSSTVLHSDFCDSGIESVNSSVNVLYKRDDANMAGVHTAPSSSLSQMSGHAHSSVPSPLVPHTFQLSSKKGCVVPVEILITGSVISIAVFHVEHDNIKEAVPLLYVRISQPHTFFSKNADTNVTQMSVFDMSIRCGIDKHTVSTTQMSARSFPQLVMETKNGEAHPVTGIPPSLLTTKCTFSPCKLPKIEVDIERPVRVSCSVDIIEFLYQIKHLTLTAVADCYDSFMPEEKLCDAGSQDTLINSVPSRRGAHAYSVLTHFSNISLNTKQLVLSAVIKKTSDGEVSVSFGTFSGCVSSTMTLQQTASASLRFNNVTVSTRTSNNQLKLLLHPWTFTVDIVMSWDSWIALSDPPLLRISVESDILAVDISPYQLECLTNFWTEYSKYLMRDKNTETDEEITPRKSSTDSYASEEQHYRDDLQAGAFQFVDSVGAREDLPLTYQVVFWSGQVPIAPTMAWKYPQPRALTKLHLMPIPFKEGSLRTKLKCILQYYSESHSSYRDYVTFQLSESEPCSVDLPSALPSQAVATTWRVVLGIDSSSEPAPVQVKALAASLRVDSFFSPVLVPFLQMAVNMTSVQALLWVHTNNQRPLPEPFTRFTSENSLPQDHCFLTASVEQSNMSLTFWNKKLYLLSVSGRPRLDILSYMTLSNQCCISPFPVIIKLYSATASFAPRYSVVTGPVCVRFGPAVCHTLASCARIWLQYSTSKPRYHIVLTPYVVCNNTCLSVRVGQAHTDEVIPLHCLQCHLYSWRSTRVPLLLRLSLLESDEINWSKGFELHTEGTKLVLVADSQKKKWPLFLTVKKVSSAVSQVIISGQLTIHNSLSAPLEVRIIPDDSTQRQSSLMVPSNAVPPSVALNMTQQVSLRIRFSTIAGLWSGLIPLRGDGSVSKHWLVKVPLKNKGQYRSVWCQIVWSYTDDIQRTLIIISPMYTICSHLACEANVQIETPDLNSSKSVVLLGRGNVQDLDCPGLSEHIHNLTFQLDGQVQASSPIVPLSYPLLEGKLEAPKPCNLNINSLLDKLNRSKNVNFWPFIGTEWKGFEWAESTQPDTVTHVKVKVTEDCIQGRSLLVELRPWALLINILGCRVYLHNNDIVLCSLPHCSIICPPSLESTFQLGVDAHSMRYLSNPLQLSRDRAFYIPRIAGLIPPNGFISTILDCDSSVIYANITSCEVEGMRLICLRSMFMIANLTTFELKITPVVVKTSKEQPKHDISHHLLETSCFVLTNQKQSAELKCKPITEWYTVGTGNLELIPYLVIRIGDVNSCPVNVKDNSDNQVIPILFPANKPGQSPIQLRLTFQQREGQTYLLLWEHPCPQITLHNNTKKPILFAKSKTEFGGTPECDSEHWNWHMCVPPGCSAHYHLQVKNSAGSEPTVLLPPAVIAIITSFPIPSHQVLQWSDAISLTPCSGRLLTLSGLPDLCMSVVKRGFTVHIVLMHASHTEILAVDIRGQLTKEYMQREERLLDDVERKTVQIEEVRVHETGSSGKSAEQHSPSGSYTGSVCTAGREIRRQAEVTCYMKSFSLTLLGQSNNGCDCQEIAAVTLDSIGITLLPHLCQETEVKEVIMSVTISDIQLDNQEYHSGRYDFPVILMKQSVTDSDEVVSEFEISEDAVTLVKASRSTGSLLDVDVTLDFNSHHYTSVQDVSIKLQPLQVYIEDTYLLHLKDSLTNIIPAVLLSEVPSKEKQPISKKSMSCVQSEVNKEAISSEAECAKSVNEYKQNDITKYNADSASQNNDNRKQANEDQEEDLFNVSESDEENQNTALEEASVNEKHHAYKSVQEFDLLKKKDATFESEVLWNIPSFATEENETKEPLVGTEGLPVPLDILTASQELAQPLRLRSLNISDIHLLVSVHTSTRFYIALDHSPLHLSAFKRLCLETTAYRMGHALTLHYFLGAIYGTGWAISSLELLGAPGGLARTLGSGLRDFVSLPYRGILLGPRAFLVGIAHGSASLMKHITAGTLTSVTKLAASWARTLDRLTLDRTDLQHTEELRRMRPHGLTQGLVQGLTEFGINLLGAISSIAHHPLQYVMSNEPDRSLVNSIGLGLVSVITRPLSGAAELVALTGEGLLSGAGWSNAPRARHQPVTKHSQCGSDSLLKYSWKFLFPCELLLYITEATNDSYEAVTLLITNSTMYVVNTDLDVIVRAVTLTELCASANRSDPTLIVFHIQSPDAEAEALSHHRVAEFVRESQRVLIGDQTHFASTTPIVTEVSEPALQFYISPQVREHFLAVLKFAKQHAHSKGFPVIT